MAITDFEYLWRYEYKMSRILQCKLFIDYISIFIGLYIINKMLV